MMLGVVETGDGASLMEVPTEAIAFHGTTKQALTHLLARDIRPTDQHLDWLRVLFCFDPRRQVILLLGGDKTGEWNDWHEWAVPLADDLYDEYLR